MATRPSSSVNHLKYTYLKYSSILAKNVHSIMSSLKKIVLLNVIATKKIVSRGGGVGRLYELLSGAKKNCPVQFQIVL